MSLFVWRPTFQASEGVWDGKEQYVTAQYNDPEHPGQGGTYDAHYLAGGLYPFNLATAGSGGTSTSGNAPYSICPKNWKLPINGSGNGSFKYLWSKYGITNKIGGATSADNNAAGYNANKLPLAYPRIGNVASNGLHSVGRGDIYWTATRSASAESGVFTTGAYFATIYDNALDTSNRTERYAPSSVRCLAR